MRLNDDSGMIIFAFVIGYFLFAGDPDIQDLLGQFLERGAQ